MKKNLFYIVLLISLLLNVKVYASTCSNEREIELSGLANNVNANYVLYNAGRGTYISPLDNEEAYEEIPAHYVAIYNLPDSLNAKVTRDGFKKDIVVTSKDAVDGVIYIDAGLAGSVKTFTITIRSNDSNCMNEVFKTTTVTTPMANIWHRKEVCEGNYDFSLCNEFTTTDYSNMRDSEFMKKVEEYRVQKEKEEKKANSVGYKFLNFLKQNWLPIVITILVIGAGSTYIVIRNRKKNRLV